MASTNGEDGGSEDVAFAERLMSYQRGRALWMSKTAETEDCQDHGCRREGQRIFAGEKDITHALDWMVQRVLEVAVCVTKVRRECYEKLAEPGLFRRAPKTTRSRKLFDLGTRVEVGWTMGQGSRATVRWLPTRVLGAHDNKNYFVRFERGGDWGDTERHVHPEQ